MAMYDINKTKSFYSEIAMIGDTCIYCEKEIIEKRLNKEIDIDEEHKQLKELRNKLTNRRVAKFKINGRTLCICPECISKINETMDSLSILKYYHLSNSLAYHKSLLYNKTIE